MSSAAEPAGHVVIVGTGQAGVSAAEALRGGGFAGAITLVGDEPGAPYHRPPLSKAWLAGDVTEAQLVMRAPAMLDRKGITLKSGCRVAAIDRAARTLRLGDGQQLAYSGLVLATGARPRTLPLPGLDAPNVHTLRTKGDASRIAATLADCAARQRPLVVIGGGFIGLEVAATARTKGLQVTVLEAAPRLLGRVLAPLLCDWYAELHRAHGVALRLGAAIAGVQMQAGEAQAVVLADGTRVPCGAIVLGVGVAADDALARAAGLETDHGVIVDACGRSSDPLIMAAGDCAARRLPDGRLLRLESVQNATEQGRCAAAALLGQERPFSATPWFWSDQYDKKLQMAGLSQGADQWVLRGDTSSPSFSVFHYRDGRLIAVDSVNAAKDHLLARKLLDAAASPTPAQVADTGFDLAQLLA